MFTNIQHYINELKYDNEIKKNNILFNNLLDFEHYLNNIIILKDYSNPYDFNNNKYIKTNNEKYLNIVDMLKSISNINEDKYLLKYDDVLKLSNITNKFLFIYTFVDKNNIKNNDFMIKHYHNMLNNLSNKSILMPIIFSITSDNELNILMNNCKFYDLKTKLLKTYPYYNLIMTKDDMFRAFDNIKKYKLKFVKKPYKIININDKQFNLDYKPNKHPTLIKLLPNDYYTMNWLSNYFNESARIKCIRYDEQYSQEDYWNKNKHKLVNELLSKNYTYRHLNNRFLYNYLNESVYENVIGCNNFRPGLLVGFIKLYNAKSVLDFSAGWGDRLIAAIAMNIRYVGVDPNENVHIGYNKIIETLGNNDKNKYTMIKSPFQDAILPKNELYDIVFTSPPYFNLEKYTDDKSQSISEFNDLETWFNKFLMTSITKAYSYLNTNGYLLININNIRNYTDFTMRMVHEINKFDNITYLGVISYAEKQNNIYKSPQPVWIWKKK